MRIANLYANVLFLDLPAELRQCFGMLTTRSAGLLNFKDYGFAVGHPADVVMSARRPEQAMAEISRPLAAFKHGRRTMAWSLPQLLRPVKVERMFHLPGASQQVARHSRVRPKAGARNPGLHAHALVALDSGFGFGPRE